MMAVVIPESFIALKAVDGTMSPPLGKGDYKELMDREWHKDPQLGRQSAVRLCHVGWHAFPLTKLSRWWPAGRSSLAGAARHIWVVEMSGYAEYTYDKMCASLIRFIERLSKTELTKLDSAYLGPIYGSWNEGVKDNCRRISLELGFDGLVLCDIQSVKKNNYILSSSPRLLRV